MYIACSNSFAPRIGKSSGFPSILMFVCLSLESTLCWRVECSNILLFVSYLDIDRVGNDFVGSRVDYDCLTGFSSVVLRFLRILSGVLPGIAAVRNINKPVADCLFLPYQSCTFQLCHSVKVEPRDLVGRFIYPLPYIPRTIGVILDHKLVALVLKGISLVDGSPRPVVYTYAGASVDCFT